MTTEAEAPGRTPWRARFAGVSVRTRITATVAVLTALALAGTGLLVYTLERSRTEESVAAVIEQEISEFRVLQEQGVDPRTQEPFTSVPSLIELFISRNVPDDDEALIGFWDGRPRVESPASPHPEFTQSAELQRVIDARLLRGGSDRLRTEFGTVIVTVVPTSNSAAQGALVLVNFLSDEYQELDQTIRTYTGVALVLWLLVTGAAALQAGRLLAPLRELRDTAQDISGSDLSRRIPVTGNDDITALTRTVNQMLDRLENAFIGQRQFLDDAGHELKTPLTIVAGHMELLDVHDPEEVESTRALMLDEVDRMSRLVQDLIMLAKTDRPDFIRLHPVNIAPLLSAVLEKCRALGDRSWVLDGRAELLAEIDEQRITQALLQLASNAVKHTRDGDEIGVGSRVTPEHGLELWVRDTGPGVPDTEKQLIFDRFARGSHHADDDGFGLGLSIVSAIARGHGGSVVVHDAPGGGAVFTLSLPVARKDT